MLIRANDTQPRVNASQGEPASPSESRRANGYELISIICIISMHLYIGISYNANV